MIRRGHRRGDYLVRDDITGKITYASKITRDGYGFYTEARDADPRHPQEFIQSLRDPMPVELVLPQVPQPDPDMTVPIYIGLTNVKTPMTGPGAITYDVGVGEMEIGLSFIVR